MAVFSAVWLAAALAGCSKVPDQFHAMAFDQALAKAAKERRVVIVDFYTTWCGPCKRLEKETWGNPGVRSWLAAKAVAVKIDAEKDEVLAKRFRVTAYPTIVLLKSDGKEVDRWVGCRDAKTFLGEVGDALAGRDTVTVLKAKLAKLKKGDKEEPGLRVELGEALAGRNRPEAALREFLWAFDNSTSFPELAGVRVSYWLRTISRFGASYPPALAALRARRDRAREAVMAGRVTAGTVGNLSSLNDHLKEGSKTLEVYDSLARSRRLRAADRELFFRWIFDTLMEKRRYADVTVAVPDPIAAVKGEIEGVAGFKKYASQFTRRQRREILKYLREDAVEKSGRYYEAFLGAGNKELAGKIRDGVLAFDSSGATFVRLIEAAARAGDPAAARELAFRGEAAVGWWSPRQRKLIRAAAAAIPK
jgi:thiol-disulfide isomerase/thioredoxin